MSEIVAFFRAFPHTRETVCSEPVVAWLASRGVIEAADLPAQTQRDLWRRVQERRLTLRQAVRLCASRLDMTLHEAGCAAPGEAVVMRSKGGAAALGVFLGDELCIASSFGQVVIVAADIAVVFRKRAG